MSNNKNKKIQLSELDLPDENFTEEDLWQAIAEQSGLDMSDISDGDILDFI